MELATAWEQHGINPWHKAAHHRRIRHTRLHAPGLRSWQLVIQTHASSVSVHVDMVYDIRTFEGSSSCARPPSLPTHDVRMACVS